MSDEVDPEEIAAARDLIAQWLADVLKRWLTRSSTA